MQSNKSSRRGFFGKTLAFLGAAFACSKTSAAANAAAPDSTPPLPIGPERTFFRLYDENGNLVDEQVSISYCYPGAYHAEIQYDGPILRYECCTSDGADDGFNAYVDFRDPL